MNSLKAGPTMTQVRSRLLDARLLAQGASDLLRADVWMTATDRESVITDIGILLNIIDESVEVINAWETSQPRIVQSEEAKVRLASDNRR